jgi:hypothetical protein
MASATKTTVAKSSASDGTGRGEQSSLPTPASGVAGADFTNGATIKFGGKTYKCPFADLLPPQTPEELDALRDDIQARKEVEVPITVSDEDELIDGHGRLKIAAELGLGIKKVKFKLKKGLTAQQKEDLAIDLNMRRRHLGTEGKRKVVGAVLKRHPDHADNWIARRVGVSHATVGDIREGMIRDGEILAFEKHLGEDGKWRPAKPKTRGKTTGGAAACPPAAGPANTGAAATNNTVAPCPDGVTGTTRPVGCDPAATPADPAGPPGAGVWDDRTAALEEVRLRVTECIQRLAAQERALNQAVGLPLAAGPVLDSDAARVIAAGLDAIAADLSDLAARLMARADQVGSNRPDQAAS